MKRKYSTLILYLLFFIYYEAVSIVLMFNSIPSFQSGHIILFSLHLSLIFYFISSLFKEKTNKILTIVFLSFLAIFYIFNYLYYSLFNVPFSISTLELAGQAMDFYQIGFHLFVTKIIEVFIFLIPLFSYFIYSKYFDYTKKEKKNYKYILISMVVVYGISLLSLNINKNSLDSAYNLYYNVNSMIRSNKVLGIFTTQRLSLKRNIFGFEEKIILDDNFNKNKDEDIKYNMLDIDFDSLINEESDENIKNIYNYFKNTEPTNQNEYTGLYKGKNLIFILAEGFNSIAVDKNLTPALYKLVNEGFNFTNYYSPVFLSTTGGEFQAMTSLIPTQEILGVWRNNNPLLPFSIGNSFSNMGYNVQSYHNWSYKYYGRNNTMPTLGFNNYTACGNGLENRIDCSWLPSDIDLFKTTIDDYTSNTPFLTYYISVSGHAPYVFSNGNSIAKKNMPLVESLPYSDSVKAYIACQLELEYALEELIASLDSKGILDDTVLVLTGDHYPYTLTVDEINEISKYERDEIITVNHSNLIIWNNNNESREITKVASQLDVLPTILNLFGIQYDSRLLIGKDIFSDAEGLAIFSDRSWVSDKGKHYYNNKHASDEMDDEYIKKMNKRVQNSFTISESVMKNDLYRKILNS